MHIAEIRTRKLHIYVPTNFLYLEELPKLLLQLFFQINSPIMMYIIYKKDGHFPTNNLDQLTKLFKY